MEIVLIMAQSHINTVISDEFAYPSRWQILHVRKGGKFSTKIQSNRSLEYNVSSLQIKRK